MTPQEAVTQDSSCVRGFLWNVDHQQPPARVVERLQAAGWAGTCHREVLWIMRRDHCKVVFVPHSGRLQVRVDMLTPFEDRRPAAEEVWRVVVGLEPP